MVVQDIRHQFPLAGEMNRHGGLLLDTGHLDRRGKVKKIHALSDHLQYHVELPLTSSPLLIAEQPDLPVSAARVPTPCAGVAAASRCMQFSQARKHPGLEEQGHICTDQLGQLGSKYRLVFDNRQPQPSAPSSSHGSHIAEASWN